MNSVEKEVSIDTIYNEIRMLRAESGKSFLLVEGSSDARVLKRFTSEPDCSVVVCLGKDRLFGAISKLESSLVDGVLAFADRDFSDLIGYPEYHGNVVFTDENDLEAQILSSQVLINILNEFGSMGKVASVMGDPCVDPHETIAAWAAPTGALRLASTVNSWGLYFSEMAYKFVAPNSPEICPDKTSKHVLSRSSKASSPTEAQAKKAITENLERYSSWVLSNGHDCVAVLSKSLRNRLGSTNEFNSKEGNETLAKILRLSYAIDMFRATHSYAHIRFWEKATGFIVLQDTRSMRDAEAA
ncbi:hypothetical protein BFP76_12805 [Amylibacter kogurei]|uniref:Uncharacterized protein n=1 Tax=Paramylibacter kogurei TaxID=1889778 RepID=A0A2G5K8M1_9RHOB|nr:DUF4435 domain-containing protein [Amylibacter kogurei]PIB25876.1 hypothetical protein BFP76_12805 [Amylibacter kogurei]